MLPQMRSVTNKVMGSVTERTALLRNISLENAPEITSDKAVN